MTELLQCSASKSKNVELLRSYEDEVCFLYPDLRLSPCTGLSLVKVLTDFSFWEQGCSIYIVLGGFISLCSISSLQLGKANLLICFTLTCCVGSASSSRFTFSSQKLAKIRIIARRKYALWVFSLKSLARTPTCKYKHDRFL